MGNTGICCHNNYEISKPNGELTTERYTHNPKKEKISTATNSQHLTTTNSRMANKIMTEADDNQHSYNMNLHGYNNNNRFVVSSNSYENEQEMGERINHLRNVADKAPKLNLEIINSNVLPQGIILKINAMGLENSMRGKKDGIVYFGFQEDMRNAVVDYLIRPKDQEYDNRYIGRHFQIYFNLEAMKYYLKDLGNGFGTFVKIQSETLLRDNSLINIGDSYLVCTMGVEEENLHSEYAGSDHNIKIPSSSNKEYEHLLNVKIFSGNNKYDPMNFLPTKSTIRIGRSPDSEITVDDNMLSRVHCTIEYRENVGWIIRDGYLSRSKDGSYESKFSTNGTWIYAMDDTMIYEGMIFKANHNLFEMITTSSSLKESKFTHNNNDLSKLHLEAYQAYKSADFETAIDKFKQLNSIALSGLDLELSAETLLNIAIMHYYSGKLSKAYHFISEALQICQSLFKKKSSDNPNLKRIYLRTLSNFTMISISMNLCDDSLNQFDMMLDYMKDISDQFLRNEFFDMIVKNFLFLPILDTDAGAKNGLVFGGNKNNSANLFLDNDYEYGGEIFLLLKSVNSIILAFLHYLKNEKGIDFFIKSLQEATSNLTLINDHYLGSLPLVNLSLMKLIKDDGGKSKEIFKDFLKIFKGRINFNLDEENAYSKIINEQFQKLETAKIIYESLGSYFKENNNFEYISENSEFIKNLLIKENKNIFEDSYNKQNYDNIEYNKYSEKFNDPNKNNILYKLILKKIRNDLLHKISQNEQNEENENYTDHVNTSLKEELAKINLAIELIDHYKYSSQIKLKEEIFSEVESYFTNNLKNLLIIYRTQKLRKFFKIFQKRTLIYENIKDYRLYVKRSITEPALKKYFFMCLENFRSIGYQVTKFNFRSAGKKEKFMKFEIDNIEKEKEREGEKNKKLSKSANLLQGGIIFSPDKKFKFDVKRIPIESIKSVVFGVNTLNLKTKYPEFQREKFRKPWLFLSLILNSGKKNTLSKSKINTENKYTSIDLFLQDDNEIKEIIFSLNLVKKMYGLEEIKIIPNREYIIQRLKLKMLERVKDDKKVKSKNEKLLIESTWSFTKLFLYIVKKKLKINQNI